MDNNKSIPFSTPDAQHIFFDVDETLVSWYENDKPEELVTFVNYGYNENLKPVKEHIERLKGHKAQGHTVIVWSAAGVAWAKEVVNKLGLDSYVDVVMSKPNCYYDDLPVTDFMPHHNRVYRRR